MSVELGRKAEVYVGASDPGATKVAKAYGFNFDRTTTKADLTSNDSGAHPEHRVDRVEGDLTCKAWTDRADSGQDVIYDALDFAGSGTGMVYVEYRPDGTGTGKVKYNFYASVSAKKGAPENGHAVTDFTFSPSGSVTRGTQS